MIHIPILRHGEPYKSLDVARVAHHQTRELFVEISQANAGLIRRDLRDQKTGRRKLAQFSTAELVDICSRAADHFLNDTLPLGEDPQTPRIMCSKFPRPPDCLIRSGAQEHAEDSQRVGRERKRAQWADAKY